MRLDSPTKSLRARTLLPNEARLLSPIQQRELTQRFLLPKLEEIERYLLAVRKQLDAELCEHQPVKLGKTYPLGQCLEIAKAVQKRLSKTKRKEVPVAIAKGFDALREFRSNGGLFRLVWGDLRGQYFQNAFQLGTLYVDVANDTVVPTKPKVEILSFNKAQFTPIRDFEHFRLIARRYWEHEIYPNHIFPELAPYCPFIHLTKAGKIQLHDVSDYMLSLAQADAYESSEFVLRESPMPLRVFEQVQQIVEGKTTQVASTPEDGRKLALQYCQRYRDKRWHFEPEAVNKFKVLATKINWELARKQRLQNQKEKPMSTITIDNIDYEIEDLSEEANAQIQSIQFVDQELARLKAQTAVLQTARNTYVTALKSALPK